VYEKLTEKPEFYTFARRNIFLRILGACPHSRPSAYTSMLSKSEVLGIGEYSKNPIEPTFSIHKSGITVDFSGAKKCE